MTECHPLCHRSTPGPMLPPLQPTCTHPAQPACWCDTSLVSAELLSLQNQSARWRVLQHRGNIPLFLSLFWYDRVVSSVIPPSFGIFLSHFVLPLAPVSSLEVRLALSKWPLAVFDHWLSYGCLHDSDSRLRCQHNIWCFPAPLYDTMCVNRVHTDAGKSKFVVGCLVL